MKRPTILISKMGSVTYSADEQAKRTAKRSSAGEQGTTLAVVDHLLSRGDLTVVFFGTWRGDKPDGLVHVEPDVTGMTDYCTAREQKERWSNDLLKIVPLDPKLYVTIAGYASSRCDIGNVAIAAVQLCATRYTAPILNVIERCKLPRIVILNDTRNVPQEGEMSLGWDHVRPVAMLSQRDKNWSRVIMGKRWDIREVYSAAEHWRDFTRLPHRDKTAAVTVIGHAHMLDGKRLKGYDDVWQTILGPEKDVEILKQMGMRVYGKGWEHFSKHDSSYMLGLLKPHHATEILASSKTCPCAITGGELYTNKPRFCLAQTCLPLFYGDGGPYTMDPLGKYVILDSCSRIKKQGDLLRLVQYFDNNDVVRQNFIDSLWKATEPDYSLLDECIDGLLAGRDTGTSSWWATFGGYRRQGNEQ